MSAATGDGPRAAVDVGSNSCRLLVVDADGAPVVREMEITRLGKGVDERGHLDDGALERTLEVISRYRQRWEEHGVPAEAVRIGATSAVRDAEDRDRFFHAVEERTGVRAVVLSGDEEARATFGGVAARLDVPSPLVVLDVGGGSTELIVGGRDGDVVAAVSLQLGSVRLTERLLHGDPPTGDEIRAAREEVRSRLEDGGRRLGDRGADPAEGTLVGVAGTVTTLTALHLDLDVYDPEAIHGTRLPRAVVDELTDVLLRMPVADRADLPQVSPGREDVIAGGALIVRGVMERFGHRELVTSEADILDGLVLQ